MDCRCLLGEISGRRWDFVRWLLQSFGSVRDATQFRRRVGWKKCFRFAIPIFAVSLYVFPNHNQRVVAICNRERNVKESTANLVQMRELFRIMASRSHLVPLSPPLPGGQIRLWYRLFCLGVHQRNLSWESQSVGVMCHPEYASSPSSRQFDLQRRHKQSNRWRANVVFSDARSPEIVSMMIGRRGRRNSAYRNCTVCPRKMWSCNWYGLHCDLWVWYWGLLCKKLRFETYPCLLIGR